MILPIGQLFFGFGGRINRAKWWLVVLVYFVAWMAVYSIVFVTILRDYSYAAFFRADAELFRAIGSGWFLLGAVGIVSFVSLLALTVKRLHDRGKGAWWVLVFVVLPWLLSAVAVRERATSFEGPASGPGLPALINLVILIWALVELGFLRGTAGANRFGSDPLGLAEPSYPGAPPR